MLYLPHPQATRQKISRMCGVAVQAVISNHDMADHSLVPSMLADEGSPTAPQPLTIQASRPIQGEWNAGFGARWGRAGVRATHTQTEGGLLGF